MIEPKYSPTDAPGQAVYRSAPGTTRFINRMRDEIPDSEAQRIVERARQWVLQGEIAAKNRLERGQLGDDIWEGKIWNEEDEAFFEDLNLTQYSFQIQRPLFNKLVENQKSDRIQFRVGPKDLESVRRYRKAEEEFLLSEGENFASIDEARRYFQENYDDEYALMLSALIAQTRDDSSAKEIESEVFEGGVRKGQHWIKVTYGTKYDRSGGIVIESVPQNAIIYDEIRSRQYDLSDIRFVGQVYDMMPEDLEIAFPDAAEQIRDMYGWMTNPNMYALGTSVVDQRWKDFYRYEAGSSQGRVGATGRLKVVDLWMLDTEECIQVTDSVTGENYVAKHGKKAEEIYDELVTQLAAQRYEEVMKADSPDTEMLRHMTTPDFKEEITQEVFNRFTMVTILERVYYQCVFTYNALLEYRRSPYPHKGHPFQAYFPQFNEGSSRGVTDDIIDPLIALNKALAFREMMMAHGAKNILFVDEVTLNSSSLTKEDIAEQWTRVGSVVALKLKSNARIEDVVREFSTIGQGMPAIENMIASYGAILREITGVTMEQLGVAPGESPAAKVQMQLTSAKGNNGILYHNFLRTLSLVYKKVMMMEIEMLKYKKRRVINILGDEYEAWSKFNFSTIEWNRGMELFEESLRQGQLGLTLIPESETAQFLITQQAMLYELAQTRPMEMPVEMAIKYSGHPRRNRIIHDLRVHRRQMQLDALADMMDFQQIQEIIMSDPNMSPEQADRLIRKMRIEQYKALQQQQQPSTGKRSELISQLATQGKKDNRMAVRGELNASPEP